MFLKLKSVHCGRVLNLEISVGLLPCLTLLYGVDAWILKQAKIQKFELFQLWCYRRMLRTSWTDCVTKSEYTNSADTKDKK